MTIEQQMYGQGYVKCALCGTKRPESALEPANGEVSATHDIGVKECVCSDRTWCDQQKAASK